MRACTRTSLVVLLAFLLAVPAGPFAQEPPPAASDGAAALAGAWEGWAKLTNDWPGLSCRYEGGPSAASVHLELAAGSGRLRGSVAIDLSAEPSSGCPPLRKRYVIAEVSTGADTVSFTDSGGNEWTLSRRRAGAVLQGMLAWRQGGPEQPLAEGFAGTGGSRPQARLSGEVRVHRAEVTEDGQPVVGGAAEGAGARPAAAAPAKTSLGRHLRNVGAVVGANVVALGLLYGANKIGKGSNTGGVVTCSPRVCYVGAPNAPCLCPSSSNIVNAASCGSTISGVGIGGPCDGKTTPCQAGLSCNSNVCEDSAGRCPW